MPLFPTNLADLKGLNPLNLFSSEPEPEKPVSSTSTPNTPIAGSTSTQAVAGPGPSSSASAAAVANRPSLGAPINSNSTTSPPRPCLKQSSPSPTSSISSESIPGRRKTSSVMIADPEVSSVSGDGERERDNDQSRTGSRKKQRPLSTTSFIEAGDGKSRKKKKPLDTYIIVKPPPNTSKNPLNLQIQLVVKPSRRGRTRSASAFSTNSSSTMNTNDGASIAASMSPGRQTVDLPDETASSESIEPVTPASTTSQKAFLESPAAAGDGPKRSNSVKSSISTTTTSTSSGSLSSGKRIEPMFNLAVHNVMHPTVVTDAATDVKVAKFLKRTLDINGVGVLEPAEVWLNTFDHAPLQPITSRLSDDGHATARPARPLSVMSAAPLSPTLAPIDDGRSARTSLDLKGFKFENLRLHKEGGGEGRTRKFFGKVFRKGHNDDLIVPTEIKTSPSPSISGTSAEPPSPALLAVDKANTLHPHAAVRASVSDIIHASVGHPTFGTSPMVMARRQSGAIVMADGAVTGLTAAPTEPAQFKPEIAEQAQALPLVPSSRPVGYTWTVKKWARKNAEGWAAHIVAAAAAGLEMVGNGSQDENSDEVVFEWVKLRVPSNAIGSEIMRRYSNSGVISSTGKNRTRSRSKSESESLASTLHPNNVDSSTATATASLGADSDNQQSGSKLQIPKRSASPLPPSRSGSAPSSALSSPRLDARPEPVRRLSSGYGISPSAPSSRRASPTRRISNTSLDVDKLSLGDRDVIEEIGTDDGGEGEDSDPEDSETPWTCSVWVKKTGQRQLLGTLTPAPHHPKVIGILKIPMGLDSIALTDVKEDSIKNVRNASEKIKALKEGVAMTEENLKDVVCVTAMWLVAREEFGGLGKKKNLR